MQYAIFGTGLSGMGALKLLQKLGHRPQVVNSGDPQSWENLEQILKFVPIENCHSQLESVELLGSVDVIVLSPGISKKSPILKIATENKVRIINEVELAASMIEVPVIAVTGTNGKTTTCKMIAKALEMTGAKVFLGGNIGVPVCELILNDNQYDYAVIELSSFQLETINHFRSVISIITNISPSHMERYDGFDEYYQAKLRLVENNRSQDLILVDKAISHNISKKHKIIKPIEGFNFGKSKLVGSHNEKNFYCVQKVLEFFDIGNRDELIQDLINNFEPVAHRLELVGETHDGVKIYNDSKSTNFTSTRVALDSFTGRKVLLMIGGKLRDDDPKAALNLKDYNNVIGEIIVFGEAASTLKESLKDLFTVNKVDKISDAIEIIKQNKAVDVILFSPAFPSFDQYSGFMERGEDFKKNIQKLIG